MNESYTIFKSDFCQIFDRLPIQCIGQYQVLFSFIHGRVGCTVDNNIDSIGDSKLSDHLVVCDIKRAFVHKKESHTCRVIDLLLYKILKFTSQLSA